MRALPQALAAGMLGALALPAGAQQDMAANVKACTNQGSFSLAEREAACTALIDSGAVAANSLAAVLLDRGGAYSEGKDYDRAIADYTRAIGLNPELENAFYDRAEAYRLEKNYSLAVTDYDRAIQLDPNDADALFGRGLAKTGLGQKAAGDADMTHAKAIDPRVATAFGL